MLGKAANDPNEIIRTLAALDKPRRAKPIIAALEDRHTPLDFADALSRADSLFPTPRSLLLQSTSAKLLDGARPEAYRRVEIAADITMYSDPAVPPGGKSLIFAFTGLAHRLMIPIAAFLQLLPAQRFDLVILVDHANLAFESGIPSYAATLPELVARLAADVGRADYQRVVTLGTSAGGLPALRAGILLGAERSIGFGPRFNWHVGRLLKGAGTIPAFDLLCACGPRGSTRLIAVYAEGQADDAEHAARLARILLVETRPIAGADRHNVIDFLVKAGRFREFLLGILEDEPQFSAVSRDARSRPLPDAPLPPHMLL